MTSRTKRAEHVPVTTWWEPVDDETSVMIARQAVEEGGYLYELSATLIVDRPTNKREAIAQSDAGWRALAEVRERHGRRLPMVARVEGTKIVALFEHSDRSVALGDILHHPSSRRDLRVLRVSPWYATVAFEGAQNPDQVPHKFVHGCVRYLV